MTVLAPFALLHTERVPLCYFLTAVGTTRFSTVQGKSFKFCASGRGPSFIVTGLKRGPAQSTGFCNRPLSQELWKQTSPSVFAMVHVCTSQFEFPTKKVCLLSSNVNFYFFYFTFLKECWNLNKPRGYMTSLHLWALSCRLQPTPFGHHVV